MAEQSFLDRIKEYQPPQIAIVWSFAAGVVLTLVLGFTAGGWVTGGSAMKAQQDAVGEARAELAAAVCVDRFMTAQTASQKLEQLRATRGWQRRGFLEEGGWVTLAGMEEPIRGAAALCAARLMEVELVPEESELTTDA